MMFLRRPWSWFGWCLAGVFLVAGCASDAGPSGSVGLEIVLENGAEINEVFWRLTGETDPLEGVVDTSGSDEHVTLALEVPAAENYLIKLWATSEDGNTTCEGSSDEFDVVAGMHTQVGVKLKCQTERDDGAVLVDGWINICAQLAAWAVVPTDTSVGKDLNLHARATDDDGDDINYLWTGTPPGNIADRTAQDTTYTCTEEGDQWITIEVSDAEGCVDGETVEVTCFDDGGTGGTGGGGGVGGAGGVGGSGGAGGVGGSGGVGGTGGIGGIGGVGGVGGAGGAGGIGGSGGAGGAGGIGGVGGTGGMAGAGGEGGAGGAICIPDGDAPLAGTVSNRPCGTGSCGAMEVCVDDTCEPAALVFVSSTTSDAALGGPRGADETCAELAEAAGLGGYWFSWTSDPCTSPYKRFEKSTLPYRMLDGTQISSSWARLTMNPPPIGEPHIDANFNLDENGNVPASEFICESSVNAPEGCFTWTNTNVLGRVDALANNNGCLGLTTNDSQFAPSTVGDIYSRFSAWTDGKFFTCGIDNVRIFCFEQSEADPIP